MVKKSYRRLKSFGRAAKNRIEAMSKTKIFVVGRNKTGTTSLKKAFEDLGFPVGDQRVAERLYQDYYFAGDFGPIIRYCKSAQVFQDVPFSAPDTFRHLDKAFPGSKFILTVRDDAEQWYQSISRFHAKKWGRGGRVPTTEDLKEAVYIRKGAPYNTVRLHGTPDDDPYNKEIMIAHYQRHNQDVMDYFRDRPDDLLVINVSDPTAYQRLVEFLGVNSPYDDFPWVNRT